MEWPIGNTFYISHYIHIVVFIHNRPIIYYLTLYHHIYTVGAFLVAVIGSPAIGAAVTGSPGIGAAVGCSYGISAAAGGSYGFGAAGSYGTAVAGSYGNGAGFSGSYHHMAGGGIHVALVIEMVRVSLCCLHYVWH